MVMNRNKTWSYGIWIPSKTSSMGDWARDSETGEIMRWSTVAQAKDECVLSAGDYVAVVSPEAS